MKNHLKTDQQINLFSTPLEKICSREHPLCVLSQNIDWDFFDSKFGSLFHEKLGRPSSRTRLIVGLHFLKAMYNESDESVVYKWVENPYWQHFCGEVSFQHELPIDPTTLNKWRKKIKADGFEDLFKSTIEAGIKTGTITKRDFEKIIVDTTVQEKAITFPTDAKLYHKMREKLVIEAKRLGIELRRTFKKASKSSLIMQGRYRHARQLRRAAREVRSLRIMMGRVKRDLERKTKSMERGQRLQDLLDLAERLYKQKRNDQDKIYSLHCPEVECIAKGKAHKKYEFGCKVGFATSSRGNFVLGAKAFHGNPFDGHTLKDSLAQVKKLIPAEMSIEDVFVDRGYKGHGITDVKVHMDQKKKKSESRSVRKWLNRRAAIEPLIGHMKNDGGPKRNHLLGVQGDQINALLMAIGFNLRKVLGSFDVEALKLFFNEIVRHFLLKMNSDHRTLALSF
jgi:IS5 family transposase